MVTLIPASLLALTLATLAGASPEDAAGAPSRDAFVERTLANGTRLSVLQVKDAAQQTFFAFLPIGLASDDRGCAQWSHALEHMLIRATDPEGLADGEIEFNGETTDGALRLDVHAPPAEAARAAGKLVAWLTVDGFDAAVLEREKKNIGRELANTVKNGFNHKWATAAWAQVVRHGATEALVSGDVARATADELARYGARKIALGPSLRIVAVGPLAESAVTPLFEREFAATADAARESAPASPAAKGTTTDPPSALASGDLAATWDLPATHYLEWYLLPDATAADRASSLVLATILMMKLQSDAELGAEQVVALAHADVTVPQGRVLLFSASLPSGSADAARTLATNSFRRAIESLDQVPRIGALATFLTMAKSEFGGLPDFAAVRAAAKGRPGVELIEAQIVLSLAVREWSTGLTFSELGAAIGALTAAELLERRSKQLDAKAASRLLLTQRG